MFWPSDFKDTDEDMCFVFIFQHWADRRGERLILDLDILSETQDLEVYISVSLCGVKTQL